MRIGTADARNGPFWTTLWLAAVAVGCTSHNGQTGSPGAVECSSDADCEERLLAYATQLAEPIPEANTFTAAACTEMNVFTDEWHTGPACECERSDKDGLWPMGPAGVGCLLSGRLETCLYDDDEFPGCSIGDPESCVEVCAQAEARLAVDNSLQYEVSPRSAECKDGSCATVVQIGERCYTGVSGGTPTGDYDCSLSDEEILAQQAAAEGG